MESQFEARGIRTPFNEYDVFGYFIPGLTLVTLIYLYESCCLISINGNELEYIHAPVCHLLDRIREYLPSDSNQALATLFILSALSLLYVIGHVVASFSAIFIDRMLLYKGYGYPYEFLLDIKDKNRDIVSSMFYRGLFFWVNLVLFLIYYIETSWSKPNWLDEIVYSIIIMVVIVSIYKIIYSNAKRDFFKEISFSKIPIQIWTLVHY